MLKICNISFNKVIKIFFLNALLFSYLNASNNSEFNNYINQTKLYNHNYWLKLLHYKNGESEVDSDNFFISKVGKKNSKEELSETINALINGEKNLLCRFPLRVEWLKENIPNLDKKIKIYECPKLDKYLKEIIAKKISIVFPSSHINSPASMYGHTFLKIYDSENTSLISNAINYAAKTDETNGLLFAYEGLFGGYEGRYSILPYYEKIKEYNNLEQRDIWEYDLSFSQDEIRKIVLHTYELMDSYSYYYFFLENCSYNLLWLFEIARPNLDLLSKFKLKAIPLDTLKILKTNNLIVTSNYRYSKMKKMKYILNKIDNKTNLKEYLENDVLLDDNLSFEDKVNYLDLKIEYLKYKRSKNKLDKKDYIKNYLKYLKQRSELNKVSVFNIEKPKNPLYSHDSSKVSFAYRTDESILVDIKPAYNDIYDVSDGYLNGAYIDFLNLGIVKNKDKTFIDKLTLLDIKSYSARDLIFKPISWGINLGYKRFKNEEDYLHLKPQFGLTYSNEKEYLYFMSQSNLYTKSKETLVSIGGEIGLISNRFDNFKLGASISYDKYNKKFSNRKAETFLTYKFLENTSVNLSYTYDDLDVKRDKSIFRLYYYF